MNFCHVGKVVKIKHNLSDWLSSLQGVDNRIYDQQVDVYYLYEIKC